MEGDVRNGIFNKQRLRTLFTTTKDNIVNYQLLDLGEYGMKNYVDRERVFIPPEAEA